MLKKKTKGNLMMVSGYLTEKTGNRALDKDMLKAHAMLPASEHLAVTDSRRIIYPSSRQGGDDYWNASQMLTQVSYHMHCISPYILNII